MARDSGAARVSDARPDGLPAACDNPFELHLDAAMGALNYSKQLASGASLRFPWPDIHDMTGPLAPGWLVLFGGRNKAGKSTFLREVFNAWVNAGHRIVYVGTEQAVFILKMLWACLRLSFPAEVAFNETDPRHERMMRDVTQGQAEVAERGIMVADPGLSLDEFIRWARYAYRVKARALILDHFSRLEVRHGERWQEQAAQIREIKNVAAKSNMVILAGAQLTQGEGPLAEYEVPGQRSWAGTAELGRECDVSLQAWRPFKGGLKRGQKTAARDDSSKLTEIVEQNVMAVKCSDHRYRSKQFQAARLYVREDRLVDWTGRPSGETPRVSGEQEQRDVDLWEAGRE